MQRGRLRRIAASAFSAWSTCTKSCGTGAQSRSRSITKAATHGGYACPYLNEQRACNTHACAWHCVVSSFSAWTTCTKSCGMGRLARFQSPKYGGVRHERFALRDELRCHRLEHVDHVQQDLRDWRADAHSHHPLA